MAKQVFIAGITGGNWQDGIDVQWPPDPRDKRIADLRVALEVATENYHIDWHAYVAVLREQASVADGMSLVETACLCRARARAIAAALHCGDAKDW